MCQRLYNQGDLLEVPCELCPVRIMPEPDAITQKANEVYAFMARWPMAEHQPDLSFIFRLCGIRVGSEESQQVYERVLKRIELEREHKAKMDGTASTNGQPSQHGRQ